MLVANSMKNLCVRSVAFACRILVFAALVFVSHKVAAQANDTIYWHNSEFNREWYDADPSRFDSIDVTVNVVCDTDFNGDEFIIVNAANEQLYYFNAGAFYAPPISAGTVLTFNVHGPSGAAGNGPRFDPNSPSNVLIPAALRSYTYGTIVGYAIGGSVTINYSELGPGFGVH